MKKISFKLLTAAMTLACMSSIPVFAKDATTIKIVHTNDIHGNASDDGKKVIGFPKLVSYVKGLKAESENVLVLDAGDMFQGLPFANLEKGHSMIDLANAVGYDAMTVGNHEFDFGTKNLLDISSKLNFPMISANFDKKGGTEVFKPYIVKEFNGVKVGVFGMCTPETAFKTNPVNVEGYEFKDTIAQAQIAVKALKENEKADVVVMLSHLGLDEGDYTSDKVAEKVDGIDVIIDGHSHTVLEEGRMASDTLIASTGTALNNIGYVEVNVEDGKVTSKKASLLGYEDLKDVQPDKAVEEEIKKIQEMQDGPLSEVVGKTTVELDGTREVVRTGETNLGQLATAAIQKLTNADMVLINGGGIRASIPAGNITMKDLITVFPFGNTVMVKEVKGSDIVAALENGVSEYPNEKGGFPHTAGITFTLNADKAVGSRISDVTIAGKALDVNKTYTVAIPDFIAAGGDQYTMFKDYPVKAEYNTLMDTLVDYIKVVGTVDGAFEAHIKVVGTPASEVATDKKEEVKPETTTGVAEKKEDKQDKVCALRAYFENAGYKVAYVGAKNEITATKGEVQLTFTIGSNACKVVNGTKKDMGKLSTAVSTKEKVTYINSSDAENMLKMAA